MFRKTNTMNRLILFSSLSILCCPAFADAPEPVHFRDACLNALSPDGRLAVSEAYDQVIIFDLESGKNHVYSPDYDRYPPEMYSVGLGKPISATGVVVGSIGGSEAWWWKDGEWTCLSWGEAEGSCLSNSITPDGRRICGSIGMQGMSLDGDNLMQVPVVWNWEENDYSDPVILPHPVLDFTGRRPQYCTAVDISADGHTVLGQVRDATGFCNYPIVYREDENGEWSYEIIRPDLLNPEGFDFPPYPGDGPDIPMVEAYLDEETLEAYYELWIQTGVQPDPEEFMTEWQYAAYLEQIAVYEAWEEKNDEWWGIYATCLEESPDYIFNSIQISPEGDSFFVNVQGEETVVPWVFDLTSGEYSIISGRGKSMFAAYYAEEGRIVTNSSIWDNNESWIYEDGDCTPLYDWMKSNAPVYADWMQENMTFPFGYYEYDDSLEDYVFIELGQSLQSGIATATPDLSKIGTWVMNTWDFETIAEAYIFDVAAAAGVESMESDRPSENREREIYNLQGRRLTAIPAPGLYIINGKKRIVR